MTEARLWEGENGTLSTVVPTGGWGVERNPGEVVESPTRRARVVQGRASLWSFKSGEVKCVWAPAGVLCSGGPQSIFSCEVLRTARDVAGFPISVLEILPEGGALLPTLCITSQVIVFPLSPNSSSIPFSSPWWARMWSWNSRMT